MQIAHHLCKAVADMMRKFDAFIQKGSGWVVKQVKMFSLTVNRFTMFSGGGECTSLPLKLKRTRACISVGKNCNSKCFLRCVVATVFNSGKNISRWCKGYERAMRTLEGVSSSYLFFPVDMKGIKKFEQNWPICINVYGYNRVIYPHYFSLHTGSTQVSYVNLLLYKDHYYLIRNMSSFMALSVKATDESVTCVLLVCRTLSPKRGTMSMCNSARKMTLNIFSPKRARPSWNSPPSIVWSMPHLLSMQIWKL